MRFLALALGLLLLNTALLAWQLNGPDDQAEREPGRLAQQVNPDRVRLLPPGPAASAALAASMPRPASSPSEPAHRASSGAATLADSAVCLEVGPFDKAALPAAEQALAAALPAGSWHRETLKPKAAYVVYVGRFADERTAQRRLQELHQRGVKVELAEDLPGLEPGLVFSRHAQAAQAQEALAALQKGSTVKAIQQARVVSSSEATAVTLRVEQPTPEVRSQIAGLAPTPALRGGFRGCDE